MLGVDRPAIAGVHLRPEPGKQIRVGTLMRDDSGVVTFVVDEGYIALGPDRPIVSMAWRGADEADSISRLRARGDKIMQGGLLPAFFQNMMPEGALRELVAKEFVHGAFDSFDVAVKLGGDLPGAIVITHEAGKLPRQARRDEPAPQLEENKPVANVRFSLAGIHLKFSADTVDRKSITVPAMGSEGEIILKTPSKQFQSLPEVEFTSMKLAGAAGVRTADFWLVESDKVSGVPEEYMSYGPYALAVKRFDRQPGGRRIQIEDFAQIFGALPDAKYVTGNEATVLNAVRRFCTDSRGELLEATRRLMVSILVGDGDRHLKNTSLIYRETEMGQTASLTPAYDVVSTALFLDNRMALKFGGSDDPWRFDTGKFERAAGLLKVEPKVLLKEAKRTVERARDTWPAVLRDMPIPKAWKEQIVNRIAKLPLANELSPKPVRGVEFPEDEVEPSAAPKP
mgnify:CR=1 FL=1